MEENRSHFTMWCMLAAPLMAGNDIRKMDKEVAKILMNKEVIAVDQDRLGKQGRRYKVFGKNEIWVKQLSGDEIAVCLFNRDDHFSWNLDIDWQKEDKLFENQQLLRTPIVRNGRKATVGYQPEIWKDWE